MLSVTKTNKKNKINVGGLAFDIFNVIFMILMSIIFLYPFVNVIAMSLSEVAPITRGEVTWFPIGFNVEGYKIVFGQNLIWRAYGNTIILVVGGTLINVLCTAMIAYALAIPDYWLKKPLNVFLVITMFFNGGMVPTYLLINNLGMINTYWSLIIPGSVAAYNVFVYRSFFKGISLTLREAAYLDGANDLRILFQIYLPLSKALLATFGLFAAVGHWNRWFEPVFYLKNESMQPIATFLRKVLIVSGAQSSGFEGVNDLVSSNLVHPKNVQYATIVATIAPILCVYPFIQKYFTKGIMLGAVKG